MATIRPFRGIRPSREKAEAVAALPYDVMNRAEATEMVVGRPDSFLHVDRAEIDLPLSVSPYAEEVYQKAKENLVRMQKDGTFLQDDAPMLYIYRLTMNGHSQTGLVACTSIDEYQDGIIKKHELTRADKETDRIRHVDVLNANTGPIFLAYRGEKVISDILEKTMHHTEPEYDFVAEDGVEHTVWVLSGAAEIQALITAFQKVPNLYIADGHHRNASAVKVGLMRREANPGYTGEEEFNYYLSVLFAKEELRIMDYNRVVRDLNGLTEEAFLDRISEQFLVEPYSDTEPYHPEAQHTFGMYLSGKWYRLKAKDTIIPADVVGALDVSILQEQLLYPILGIADPRTDARIDFVGGIRGLAELQRRVDSDEMKVAFSLFPTSMEELMHVADLDRLMPPKSTWFEPKLRSGLFLHDLEG